MADSENITRVVPFTAFNFSIELKLEGENGKNICNAAFSECDGLEMTMEPKTIREGGNNSGPIHLVGPVSYGQLSLKRGMTDSFDLWEWFDRVTQREQGLRASGYIVILSSNTQAQKKEVVRFRIDGCLPVKLKAPALNAKDGLLAIEEMSIVYELLSIQK